MKFLLTCTLSIAAYTSCLAQISDYYFVHEIGPTNPVESYTGAQTTNHLVGDDVVSPGKIKMPFTFRIGTETVDSIGIAENGYLFLGNLKAFALR